MELFFSFSFLPGVDASHVCVHALALGCFYRHISTRSFRRALTASLDSCAEIKECLFNGVTKSGRVRRKVPESDARSVKFIRTTLGVVTNNRTSQYSPGTPGETPQRYPPSVPAVTNSSQRSDLSLQACAGANRLHPVSTAFWRVLHLQTKCISCESIIA